MSSAASVHARYHAEVAAYVAAGGSESVQRVVTAVHGLHRRLSQWYTEQLAGLGVNSGEWSVISQLAIAPDARAITPSQLAASLGVAPSSMTHRLDKMSELGLIERTPDQQNRTRVLVNLTDSGWMLFQRVIRESDVMESSVLERLSASQREQLADLLELAITGLDQGLD